MEQNNNKPKRTLTEKIWIIFGIFSLATIILFILKGAFNVLLMILAGSLISIYFHGLGDAIQRKTQLKRSLAMTVSVAGTLILFVLSFWFLGAEIQKQFVELSRKIPEIIDTIEGRLNHSGIGRKILSYLSGNNSQKVITSFQQFFRTSFGVLGDLFIILCIGVFFTANPGIYLKGIIKLVPPKGKQDAQKVLDRLGFVLKRWLKGMLVAMLIVGILSFIGLTIIDVPMTLALALIAGILNFIPNFGPLLAMVPAALIGLIDSTNTALVIVLLYFVIQLLESNLITPLLQHKLIRIPPAMIIISQVMMGAVTGGLGVILATPLLAITIVLVDELYVKKQKV